jgi:matrixin
MMLIVHEFGHWLYLGDNDDPFSVMYAYIGRGEMRRDLTQDDIDGIRYLYGEGIPVLPTPECKKISSCVTVCEQQQTISIAMGLHHPEIESVDLDGLQTVMLQKPRPRALLFGFYRHLPEMQHLVMNHEEELTKSWEPIARDWLPGLHWLAGDLTHGQNLILTDERTTALSRAIQETQALTSSRPFRRDLQKLRKYLLTNTGRSMEDMRKELLEEYDSSF